MFPGQSAVNPDIVLDSKSGNLLLTAVSLTDLKMAMCEKTYNTSGKSYRHINFMYQSCVYV